MRANDNELLKNLDKLHTTELGVKRIKRNLSLDSDDVVDWCKTKINSANSVIHIMEKLVCEYR